MCVYCCIVYLDNIYNILNISFLCFLFVCPNRTAREPEVCQMREERRKSNIDPRQKKTSSFSLKKKDATKGRTCVMLGASTTLLHPECKVRERGYPLICCYASNAHTTEMDTENRPPLVNLFFSSPIFKTIASEKKIMIINK